MFAWAADFDGCSYYRGALPARILREHGHNTDAYPELPLDGGDWDVIIGQRTVREDTSAMWQRLAADGRRLVFEVDDDLWHIPPHNPAHGFFDPACLDRAAENASAAAAVTVSTEPLAAVLRQFNPRVHVMPNYIDEALLHLQRLRRRRVTIGWAGSPTHREDLRVCARPVKKLLAARGNVDLHVIGWDYRNAFGGHGRFTPWARPTPNYYRLIDFDIGIAPLADDEFNASKSPVKALEYAALGIPVVASNTGPYPGFVKHGVTGFLADTEQDWARYLRMLTADRGLRERMGDAAREQAADWTIQRHAAEWSRLVTDIAEESV